MIATDVNGHFPLGFQRLNTNIMRPTYRVDLSQFGIEGSPDQ